jgi:diaminopimelate decarboxylase
VNRSPVWIADVERFSSNLHAFIATWRAHWPRSRVAYSYKTNRLVDFLHAATHLVSTDFDPASGRIVVNWPRPPAEHVRAAALLLEPGRAVVADAVDLMFTVVAVKTLADGSRCLVCDAGTNFLPGALMVPPPIEALESGGPVSPALVTGPLCLNADVIHPRAQLPVVAPGARLVARSVGAYQQVAASQFAETPPPVTVRGYAPQSVSV